VSECTAFAIAKGKGQIQFPNVAFIYAGNDLLYSTCVARAPSPAKTLLDLTCSFVTVPCAELGHAISMSTDAARLTKYRYRRRLPRMQKDDTAIFVTFCTNARQICRKQRGIWL